MSQEQATQLYTGSHWKVEASVLSEVEHFSRFAARSLPPCFLHSLAYPFRQLLAFIKPVGAFVEGVTITCNINPFKLGCEKSYLYTGPQSNAK